MNGKPVDQSSFLEPERYEFSSRPAYRFEPDRREFFRVFGAGIAVFCVLKDAAAMQESGRGRRAFDERLPQEISAWLHLAEDGTVTVYTGKVEVGQNARTSLTAAVAEELRVAPGVIRLVMGDTDLTPFDMGTFGSRTTPTMSPQLRRASAAARDLLIDLAAQAWRLDRNQRERLVTANGRITDPETQRTVDYAELVKGRKLAQAIPAEDPLTPAARWTVMGESLSKIDGRDFVTGKHRYTSDLNLPGMLYGKVLRPPSFGASLASLDSREAEAMPGVTVVHDGNFVGVAAPSVDMASQALAAIRAEWRSDPRGVEVRAATLGPGAVRLPEEERGRRTGGASVPPRSWFGGTRTHTGEPAARRDLYGRLHRPRTARTPRRRRRVAGRQADRVDRDAAALCRAQ